ncbi:MAG: MvaI/BcnI family restriction endonuclease [Methanomassiliicoccales archaeon]
MKSMRRGSTGIGFTLESHLGICENNLFSPDLGNIELKAHREGSQSMITLFTFNGAAWEMEPLKAVKKYGTEDVNGRIGLYFTMSRFPNSAGLYLDPQDEFVAIKHEDGTEIVKRMYADLAERFAKKLPSLLLIYAHVQCRGRKNGFISILHA